MENNVLISIIVPCYNSSATLSETLDSVLAQTYPHTEVIIVNDGSTDESQLIIDSYQELYPDIVKCIYQENRGLPGARNTGIAYSAGEFVAFCDADDTWHPNKLLTHAMHFKNNPNLGISYSRSEFMDEEGNHLGMYQNPKLTNITPFTILTENPCGNGSAPVLSKQVLDDIEYYDTERGYSCWFDEDFKRAEDVELWLRISLTTNYLIEGLPFVLTYYRINDKGLSADTAKQCEAMQMMLTKTESYAPEFIKEHRVTALAYQYRYLARRAIRSKDKINAINYINMALKCDSRILVQSPKRTIMTTAAAYMLYLPKPVYNFVENVAIKFTQIKKVK